MYFGYVAIKHCIGTAQAANPSNLRIVLDNLVKVTHIFIHAQEDFGLSEAEYHT